MNIMNKILIITLCIISIISNVNSGTAKSHTYTVDYHTEAQSVHVEKNGIASDVNFGDIVDIGNDRKIFYIGNGEWRESDNPDSSVWPSKIHKFTAEDIAAFPQFVKTPLEVLNGQDDPNKFPLDLDKAIGALPGSDNDGSTETKSSAFNMNYNNNIYHDNNYNANGKDYFYTKKIMFIISIIFVLCCVGILCVGGICCIGFNIINWKKGNKYNNNDKLPSRQYRRLPVHAINISDGSDDEEGEFIDLHDM